MIVPARIEGNQGPWSTMARLEQVAGAWLAGDIGDTQGAELMEARWSIADPIRNRGKGASLHQR